MHLCTPRVDFCTKLPLSQVPLSTLDLTGAVTDLWLPIVAPYRQRHTRKARAPLQSSSTMLRPGDSMGPVAFEPAGPVGPPSATASPTGAPLASSPAAAVPGSLSGGTPAQGDSAHSSPVVRPSAAAPPPLPHHSDVSMSLRRMTARPGAALAALPGAALRGAAAMPAAVHAGMAHVTGSGRECLLHVRLSFSAFTRVEVEAAGAASAGRPGIVTILRR